jgi:ubiquinone/menaquinone biosynthesis C-methylase UbiE
MNTQRIWHLADETERKKWQNPEAILKEIGLKPGLTFMDVGCGGGFFTLPAARLTGAAGKVYAVDINANFVEQIKQRAASEGLTNLELKTGPAEDTLLCQSCADIVFFGIVLHDFRDAGRVLKNARAMIKPDGKLVNLDWKKEVTRIGPPVAVRFDEKAASNLIEAAGFIIEKVRDSGPDHYLITARPRV